MSSTLLDEEKDVEHSPEAVRVITHQWIEQQIKQREAEFTENRTACIFCGTYNVNAKTLGDEDVRALEAWLFNDNEKMADIYAVGFQEIVDLNAVNVAMEGKSVQRAQMWQDKLIQALNNNRSRERYVMVLEKHLVGILLLVFVREMHQRNTKEAYGATVGVGVMGMMGNKGGASIRLRFYDSTLCFVCAHLAAHRENVEGRNSDFANIIQKTLFIDKSTAGESSGLNSGTIETMDVKKYFSDVLEVEPSIQTGITIYHHDLVFWLGDLNYRLDETIETEECFQKIESNDLKYLRDYDQLNLERQRGKVFVGWDEALLSFPPTYKYQPGTNHYERRPEKKLRCPAWCDRVLWRAKEKNMIKNLSYRRAELMLSDHKPVAATFATRIKVVSQEKRHEVYQEVTRLLDKLENDAHPKLQLNVPGARLPNQVDFGAIRYGVDAKQSLFLTNISQVVAPFRFVPKLEEENICKPWLSVRPKYGMLLPNETVEITFTASVGTKAAQALNAGLDSLEDILILRLENGQDFFLSVTGQYARSCFGMQLEELTNCYEPVRSVPLPSPGWNAPPVQRRDSGASALSVPKELWRMVDALYRSGLTEKDLFVLPGIPAEVQSIRESLDTGAEFGQVSMHSMAEALQLFLASLPSPIVAEKLLPSMELDPQNLRPWSRRFLEQLPPLNYNVFVYLISFFREALKHHELNRLNTGKLVVICSNVLLAPEEGGIEEGSKEDQRRQNMQAVFSHFLVTTAI